MLTVEPKNNPSQSTLQNDRNSGTLETRLQSFEERAKQVQQEIERMLRERPLGTRITQLTGIEGLKSRLPEANGSPHPHGPEQSSRRGSGVELPRTGRDLGRTPGSPGEGSLNFRDEIRKEIGPDPLSGGRSFDLVGRLRTEMKGMQHDVQSLVKGIELLGHLSPEEARILSEMRHTLEKLDELNSEIDNATPNDTQKSSRRADVREERKRA